jgi:hypothetical protein
MRHNDQGVPAVTADRALRGIAGAIILAGATLAFLHHRNWLYFIGFVGFMLLQSSATDWCPVLWLLEKRGLPRCRPAASTSGDARMRSA